jgi:hypothetical protein
VKKQKKRDPRTFQVTVWNMMDGDIVKKLWEASIDEVSEVEEQYSDEPFMMVQVEELP